MGKGEVVRMDLWFCHSERSEESQVFNLFEQNEILSRQVGI